MNTIKTTLAFFCLTILTFTTNAQEKSSDAEVKEKILSIFEIAKTGTHKDLASHLIYRGNDEARKWKDTCNPENQEEIKHLQNAYENLQRLQQYDSYEFTEFITDEESEGKWYVWKMTFKKGETSRPVYLAFLKIKGNYALGDID